MNREAVKNPLQIRKENITIEDLENLSNNEELVIQHTKIRGLQIKVRRDYFIDNQLPVVFYSEKLQIRDNSDKMFPMHKVTLDNLEMLGYLEKLLNSPDIGIYKYYRLLYKKGLKEGDILLFENGKKGIVIIPGEGYMDHNIRYAPLKKDGTKSKVTPRYLYAGDKYEILRD